MPGSAAVAVRGGAFAAAAVAAEEDAEARRRDDAGLAPALEDAVTDRVLANAGAAGAALWPASACPPCRCGPEPLTRCRCGEGGAAATAASTSTLPLGR